MREDIAPFERREIDDRTTLWLHGTDDKHRVVVEEDKVQIILDAMIEGWDVDIEYAIISGDLDIKIITDLLGRDKYNKLIIKVNVKIKDSEFCGKVSFNKANFSRSTNFKKAIFNDSVDFSEIIFKGLQDFGEATFNNGVNFVGTIFNDFLVVFEKTTFSGYTSFIGTIFGGFANFSKANFRDGADFFGTTFNGNAYFELTNFNSDISFRETIFKHGVNFSKAIFNSHVAFNNTKMEKPANFSDVKFGENTIFKGLWNITFGRIKRLYWAVTDFSEFNTTTVMDGSSNPYLKRYIDDEQWIQSWKERSWWRRRLFFIWELTSHCGRSFTLWMFWSLLIACIFGVIYSNYDYPSWLSWFSYNWRPEFYISAIDRIPTGFTYYYFSIVAFTTLGFGDITPMNLAGEIWLAIEVVLGYIMLGGLLSIFTNKFARRS